MIKSRHAFGLAAFKLMDRFAEVDTAAGLGPRDGLAGMSDLQAVISNPKAPTDLRLAAKIALDNFSVFETHVAIPRDGLMSAMDLNGIRSGAFMSDDMKDSDAVPALVGEVIRKNFDMIDSTGSRDGLLTVKELSLAQSRGSAEVGIAAQACIDMFDIFDTAAQGMPADGKIGLSDLETVIERGTRSL